MRAAREERDATLAEIRRLERNIDEIERSIDTAPTHDPSALSPAEHTAIEDRRITMSMYGQAAIAAAQQEMSAAGSTASGSE